LKSTKTIPPPKLATRLLNSFLRGDLSEEVRGDLEEKFHLDLKTKSVFKAKLVYWHQVINYIRPFAIRKSRRNHLNNYDMFQSYFKIGWRNLLHNKGFSFINVFGLAIGMTACVLIMLYVVDEMSYDNHHKDGNRIYRIASEVKGEKFVAASAPIAEGLKKDFPEVEQSTRLLRFPGTDKMLVKDEATQKQFFETNGFYVDSTFLQVLTYDLIFGDDKTALNDPNSILLSEDVAAKFFGNENPVDHVLKITLPFGDFNYTVKGVFRTNKKSHIPANLLLSMNNSDVGGWVKNQHNWATNNIFHTYVKLKTATDPIYFESKLTPFLERNGGQDLKAAGFSKSLFIQPLPDIYLHSDYGFEVAPNGSIKYLYIFFSIAVFLLLIACINFMNLSTARSERRAKEVGLRKVIGAEKHALISQFLTESILMSVLALLLAFLLIQLAIPIFNQLINKQLSLIQLPNVYFWLVGLTIITGLLAGLYPAFYLSSFKPVTVLKGKLVNTFSGVMIRKGLVVFQFTISIVLILGAILIGDQMRFLANTDLGFNKNQKIVLPIQTAEANKNAEALKAALLTNSKVIAATHASSYPGIENINDMLFYAEGKSINETVDIIMCNAGNDYIETLGIELLQGRGFSKEFTGDSAAVVLNEAAIKQLGYAAASAVGKNIYFEWQGKKFTMNIIGVVKDYHFQSLHQEIKTMALSVSPFFGSPLSYLILDTNTNDYADLIALLEKTWKKINSDSPFAYSFLEKDFQKSYEKEELTLALIRYFTLIAIVIACLGLFGLASFTAEQRVKEIGIRKVLGSSVSQIVMLLSKDFLKLVVISFIIASPIGYYVMMQWLQGFAYHVNVSWWIFGLAGTSALLIALLTIGFQSVRAAFANPVNSLKSE
jgi:putative ABC transport system permease protein